MRAIGLLLTLMVLPALGQWGSSDRIVLVGDSAADRQVIGAVPLEGTDGATVESTRSRVVHRAPASGVNVLSASVSPPIAALQAGLQVDLIPSQTNTGPVTLSLNGTSPAQVLWRGTLPLDSGDLSPGVPVPLVYDGASFQWVGERAGACPPGFIPLSREVCIQALPNDSSTFWQAVLQCGDMDARLCTFSEWTAGCSMTGEFFSTVEGYEWVDHAANDQDKAKVLGLNSVTLVVSCDGGSHRIPSVEVRSRCCKTR